MRRAHGLVLLFLIIGSAVIFRPVGARLASRSPHDVPRRGEGRFIFVACPGADSEFVRCGWYEPHEEVYAQQGEIVQRVTRSDSMKRWLVWSPDASHFAYGGPYSLTSDASCTAYSTPFDGSRRKVLEEDEWCVEPVDWSPGGRWVLLNISYYESSSQIFRVHPDGTGMRRVTCLNPHIEGTAGGFFLRGGKEVIYSADNVKGEHGIYRIRADGKHRRLLHKATTDDFDLSPDRKTLIFESAGEVYTMQVDGSNVRRMTHNDTHERGLAFSPDGSEVAFGMDERAGGPPAEISVLDVATGDITPLALPEGLRVAGADFRLVWSPDGTRVAFVAGTLGPRRQAVYWSDVESGTTHRATTVAPSMSLWGWLPDESPTRP